LVGVGQFLTGFLLQLYPGDDTDKERTLDNVYKQLEEQGKTNMYYLFEAQIDEEFDVILD